MTNTSVSTGIRSASFTLVNDGTFTSSSSGTGNWLSPTSAGVGSNWWAKATVNTTTNTSLTGTTGGWTQLTSGEAWSAQNTATNNEGTGNFTIAFSPDGGTTTVGSMNVSWDVGYTP
jgi:hypothetical protein